MEGDGGVDDEEQEGGGGGCKTVALSLPTPQGNKRFLLIYYRVR